MLAAALLLAQLALVPSESQANLYDRLKKLASTDPVAAFVQSGLLQSPIRQDRIVRSAFERAAADTPAMAARMLPYVCGRPWSGAIHFADALRVAAAAGEERQDAARCVLVTVSRAEAPAAMLEAEALTQIPFGAEALEEAARVMPADAVALAAGQSNAAQALRKALDASKDSRLRGLARLAARDEMDLIARARLAWLDGPGETRAITRAAGFQFALDHRIGCTRRGWDSCDEAMRRYAAEFASEWRAELGQPRMRDLWALAAYAPSDLPGAWFDSTLEALIAKAEKSGGMLAAGRDAGWVNWTHLAHLGWSAGKLTRLMPPGAGAELMEHLLDAADAIDAATEAVDVASALPREQQLRLGATALEMATARRGEERWLYLALAEHWASEPSTASLDTSTLYDGRRRAVQQMIFPADGGRGPLDRWVRAFRADPRWRFEDHGSWVKLWAAQDARRMEIFANVPGGEGTEAMPEIQPSIVVHRGAAWEAEKAALSVSPAARLVYLGSAGGRAHLQALLDGSDGMQLMMSRTDPGDAHWKALSDALLDTPGRLDQEAFWKARGHKGKLERFEAAAFLERLRASPVMMDPGAHEEPKAIARR